MKNLNEYVEKIWKEQDLQIKKSLLREMINYSSATKKTKILTLNKIDRLSFNQVDKLAIDYSLSGMGMKVI